MLVIINTVLRPRANIWIPNGLEETKMVYPGKETYLNEYTIIIIRNSNNIGIIFTKVYSIQHSNS